MNKIESQKIKLGETLKRMREEKKVGIRQMQREAKINHDIIYSIERGTSCYTIDSLLKYCNHLELPISFLQTENLPNVC